MFRVKDTNGQPKYAGRSRGKVIDNRDPLQRGRIRVDHSLLGPTVWIDYLRNPGSFDVPAIGDLVYVEADSGVYEHPIAWGAVTKGPDTAPLLPAVFRRDIPTNRGIFTPGGHTIELDDGEALLVPQLDDKQYTTKNRGIRITTKGGNKIHIAEDTDNQQQYILLEDANGNTVRLDYKDNKVSILSGGEIEQKAGNNILIDSQGNITVTATGTSEFKGQSGTNVGDGGSITQVQGSQVLLGGGGPGVARLGDRAFGIGNLGGPVSSTIIQGSSKVFSG